MREARTGMSRREACRAAAVAGAALALGPLLGPEAALAEGMDASAWVALAEENPQPSDDAMWDASLRIRYSSGDNAGKLVSCLNDGEVADSEQQALPVRWAHDAARIPQAWALCPGVPGEGVAVGVFDRAVYYAHEDLPDPAASWQEDAPTGGWLSAKHGTQVAGIVAARAGNGQGNWGGGAGVAYGCSLMNYSMGYADVANMSALDILATAVETLVRGGARVINCSNAFYDDTTGLFGMRKDGARRKANEVSDENARKEIAQDNATLADRLGALLDEGFDFVICKASGNFNSTEDFGYKDDGYKGGQDAAYDLLSGIDDERLRNRIIVVGAAEALGDGGCRVAAYSAGGTRVDVVAPGWIYGPSTLVPAWQSGAGEDEVGSGYRSSRGTSFASPMVAGVAALVWSANDSLTGDQVKKAIVSSASQYVGYSDEVRAATTLFDASAQYPLLDAEAAVRMALSSGGLSGTFAYTAQVGGYRGSVTVAVDGTATVTEISSGNGVIYKSFYQVSRDDAVDASPLGDAAVAYRFTPTGTGELHVLGEADDVPGQAYEVTVELLFGYDPATDTLTPWSDYDSAWGDAHSWARAS